MPAEMGDGGKESAVTDSGSPLMSIKFRPVLLLPCSRGEVGVTLSRALRTRARA
jgi:hypothetical protein